MQLTATKSGRVRQVGTGSAARISSRLPYPLGVRPDAVDDRLAEALVGHRIERVGLRRNAPLDPDIRARIEGSVVREIRTSGKHP